MKNSVRTKMSRDNCVSFEIFPIKQSNAIINLPIEMDNASLFIDG